MQMEVKLTDDGAKSIGVFEGDRPALEVFEL